MTQAREQDRESLFVIAYSWASCIKTLDSYYSLLLSFMYYLIWCSLSYISVLQLFCFACFIHAHIIVTKGQPCWCNLKKLNGDTENVARLPGAASNFPVPSAGEPCKWKWVKGEMKGDSETGNSVAQQVIRKENKEYWVVGNQDFSNSTTTPQRYVPYHAYNCKKAGAKSRGGCYNQNLFSQFEKCYHNISSYCPALEKVWKLSSDHAKKIKIK